MDGPPFLTYNGSLIGEFCDTSPPLICDHAALGEKMSRPCSPGIESYVSKGRGLTLSEFQSFKAVIVNLRATRLGVDTIRRTMLLLLREMFFSSEEVGGKIYHVHLNS